MVREFKGELREKEKASIACFPGIYRFFLATDEPDVNRSVNGYVLCETIIPTPPDGTDIIVSGTWEGSLFNVSEIKIDFSTRELTLKLIKSAIKNVKAKNEGVKIANTLAKKILDITGEDLSAYIRKHRTETELIENLPKAGPETLGLIYTELKVIIGNLTIIPFFNELEIPTWKASKLVENFGPEALSKIKRNPFNVGMNNGLSFNDCDKIAYKLKKEKYSKERLSAAASTGLYRYFAMSGSTFCDMDTLHKNVVMILKGGAYPYEDLQKPVLIAAISRTRKFHIFEYKSELMITLKYMRDFESSIVTNLRKLSKYKPFPEYSDLYLTMVEHRLGIKYEKEQLAAIKATSEQGVHILTGGPGTGKTTTVAGIIELYKLMGKQNIILCAPTGRAAQRMKEATSMEASTIHRLLRIRPFESHNTSDFNRQEPLEADLIVVDEYSMVDTELCAFLLDAVSDNTTLVISGDEDQLRSVGPGNVLHDLLFSNRIKTTRLKKVLRQNKGISSIIENAEKIHNGETDLIEDENFKIIRCKTMGEARQKTLDIFLDKYDEDDPFKLQFMSPLRKTTIGTSSLNASVKEKYDPSFGRPSGKFRVGDRVIITKNNAGKDYYNGDLGIVTKCVPGYVRIEIQGKEIELTGEELEDVMLSYFITIHKSQGSEFEECVILLPENPAILLTKNLIYTAITRAKKSVTIITVNNALEASILRKAPKVQTGLSLLLGVKDA